jgi:hypothetical protein
VKVTFWRVEDGEFSVWEADRGHRRIVPGTAWKDGRARLPHDLAGMLIEAELGLQGGFWWCVAAGATFKSLGRKVTKPGRQIILDNRAQLDAVEKLVHVHIHFWETGQPTPAAPALDRVAALWARTSDGSRLTIQWPTCVTELEPPNASSGAAQGNAKALR